jgi:hypothetical protein
MDNSNSQQAGAGHDQLECYLPRLPVGSMHLELRPVITSVILATRRQ